LDAPQAGLKALGERVQAALEAETQPKEQLQLARAGLLARVTGRAPQHRSRANTARLRWAIGLTATAAAGLAVVVATVRSSQAPLSFETSLGERAVGDVLEAEAAAPARVTFSEGTQLQLQRGARARVLDTKPRGARVLLESGALDVAVVHRHQTRWLFEAGPFHVLVKGTEFELGWEPAQQQLSLHMKSGKVEVSGACLPAPRLVERGASLRLSCTQPAPPRVASAESPSAQGPALAATPAPAAAGAPPRPERAASATASELSFEDSCETASKAELVGLANRERLAGRTATARRALLALRKRFAGSSEAATAAFTLGRMAFEQQADHDQAARWFASYLAEQPNGPLMGDAAGRLLEAHERRGDRLAARRAAQAYLRRFPDGPYAGKAGRILAE
jgi:transmembrane sensor